MLPDWLGRLIYGRSKWDANGVELCPKCKTTERGLCDCEK